MTIKSYVRIGEQQKFFRNIFDKLYAMEQIKGLKVPSNGRFMANYKNKEEPDMNEAELLPPPEVLRSRT